MTPPEIDPLSAWHPLRGHACPVTGRRILTDGAWSVRRSDYRLDVGILERGVAVSLPVGHTALADTDRFFKILSQVRLRPELDRKAFVLIEDYARHRGSDYEGRLEYIRRMVEEIKPRGVIFATRSTTWKLSIRLGVALGRSPFPVRIAPNYPRALALASKLLERPLDGEEDLAYLWTSARTRLALTVHPGGIVQADWHGRPSVDEIPALVSRYDLAVRRAMAESDGSYLALHDVSQFDEASFNAVHALERNLLLNRPGRAARRTVVVGGETLGRLVASLAGVLADRKVETAPDVERGLRLLRETPRDFTAHADAQVPPLVTRTLALLDQLRWDDRRSSDEHASGRMPRSGVRQDDTKSSNRSPAHEARSADRQDDTKSLNRSPAHEARSADRQDDTKSFNPTASARGADAAGPELQELAIAIETLKYEVDTALAAREAEMAELESARETARKLGLDLDKAVRRSAERRGEVERLSRENLALQHDIAQAQREVLSVLADFIDARCGLEAPRTRSLGALVKRLAMALGLSEPEADRFDRACLMHHVGFVGIPDALARDASQPEAMQRHTALGHEVLSRLVGMECAAELALTHHARWDGRGYPAGLEGEAIPLVSRLFSIAQHLQDGATDSHIRSHAGTRFDPALVERVLAAQTNQGTGDSSAAST